MQLLVFTTIAMMAYIAGIAIDLGGAVSSMIFLLILFIGATMRAYRPFIEWLRGPSANL